MSRRRTLPLPSLQAVASAETEQADATTQVRSLLAAAQAISSRLAALNEVAAAMQTSLDTATVLHTLAREARWVLDFQYCSVAERSGEYYTEQILTQPDAAAPAKRRAALNDGPIGQAICAGHALLLDKMPAA